MGYCSATCHFEALHLNDLIQSRTEPTSFNSVPDSCACSLFEFVRHNAQIIPYYFPAHKRNPSLMIPVHICGRVHDIGHRPPNITDDLGGGYNRGANFHPVVGKFCSKLTSGQMVRTSAATRIMASCNFSWSRLSVGADMYQM